MDEPQIDELLHRLELAEKETRRWKAIGIGALAALTLVLVLGGVISMGTLVYTQARLARTMSEVERARMEAEKQRQQAEQARMQAEQAQQKAQRELEKARHKAEP
jgi:hypothetical protein